MKYATIVADPPWNHDDGFPSRPHVAGGGNGTQIVRALPYPSMELDEIAALPVRHLAERDARLFLWTTNRFLPDGFDVARLWGFAYKQTLVWERRDAWAGSLAPNAQFLIVATRGAPPVTGRLARPIVSAVANQRHSAKPDVFLDLVESVSPGPYLELFARRQRLGWHTWGNEALEHVSLAAPPPETKPQP